MFRTQLRSYAALFTLALLVRGFSIVFFRSWEVFPGNEWSAGWETGQIANSIACGSGFSLTGSNLAQPLGATAWLAPLYPTLLGIVFLAFGTFTPVSLAVIFGFQSLCDATTSVLLAQLGRKLHWSRAGLLASLPFALSPVAVNMSTRVIWCTSFLTMLSVVLVLRFINHAKRSTHWQHSMLTGVLIGVCLLTSPVPALFIGLAALAVVFRRHREGLKKVAIMTITSGTIVFPWIFRNYQIFGSLFFIKSNAGNELFIGNNPLATGKYIRSFEVARKVLSAGEFEKLRAANEYEASRMLGGYAVHWIADHPWRFLLLTGRKVWMYWTAPYLENWELLPIRELRSAAALAFLAGQYCLLAFAAFGIRVYSMLRSKSIIPIVFLSAYPIPYYITHANIPRYRFPVLPLVLFFASLSFVYLAAVLRGRGFRERPDSIDGK